jgi:hypothetical protein
MNKRMKCWGLIAGLLCCPVSTSFATEPFVQDFDGWKITIRPGPSSLPDPVPPSPRSLSPANPNATPTNLSGAPTSLNAAIQLVSLRQDGTPAPTPAPEKLPTGPAIDGLPIITPGESDWCCDSKPVVSPPEGSVDPRYLSQMYTEIYKSIPFIRAEYNANPSYLHDTTVEFLFGKMRPTVIHRGTVNVNHNSPYGYGIPYSYGGAGYGYGGGGYAYPPLQLVVPGTGLRIHRLN